jgi:hypothetical protein
MRSGSPVPLPKPWIFWKLELVHEDPEVSTRGPERGELALLDPLLDGGWGNLKHFTYFTRRQIPPDALLPGHGTRSGG